MNKNEKLIKRNNLSYIIISFSQGIYLISTLAVQYLFKDYLKIEPAQMALITSFLTIPWMIKPLLGLLTDLVPIFGYRRKVYLFICGLSSMICWLYMALSELTLFSILICLFINSSSAAFSSVLGEAIVVELSNLEFKGSHEIAKNYVSMFFLFKNIGVLIASFLKGYLIEIISIKHIFLLSSIIPVLILISSVILIESELESNNSELRKTLLNEINKQDKQNKKELIKNFLKFIKQKEAYIPALYVILLFSAPNFSDTFFYYMTNYLKFEPIQLGVISLASTIGVLIAIISYRNYFKIYSFKTIVFYSTILYFIFSFIALALVLRYNLMIGISDYMLCIFGFAFLSILGELSMMPMLSLACMICPPNLEGTVYSFFMSALNLGQCISTLLGSFLTYAMGITANDFTNLPALIIVSNFLVLVPLFVLYFIENKYLEPKLNEDITITKDVDYMTDEQEIMTNPNENIKKLII
jgi:MFS family permease